MSFQTDRLEAVLLFQKYTETHLKNSPRLKPHALVDWNLREKLLQKIHESHWARGVVPYRIFRSKSA